MFCLLHLLILLVNLESNLQCPGFSLSFWKIDKKSQRDILIFSFIFWENQNYFRDLRTFNRAKNVAPGTFGKNNKHRGTLINF